MVFRERLGMAVTAATFAAGCLAVAATVAAASPNGARAPSAALANAADRSEIVELSAHFDNALDAEDPAKFVAVFTPDASLQGFWGESKGAAGVRRAFDLMLATFSRNKRHVVTNHEITVTGDRASMFCYLTVFDRQSLAVTGTATFSDELVRTPAGWRFLRRTLHADPNVDPIIAKLKAAPPA